MLLAACGPAPTATPPPATQPPAATEAPTTAPTEAPAYEGLKVEAPNCDYGGEFKSMEAVDEFTVKFSLCYPDAAFLSKIAFTSYGIEPAEYLESTGGTGDILEKPIGTGPYMVESWERGNQLVYKAFPDYWGEKAKSETLVFRWGTEAAQRLLELQSGTVDAIDNVGTDDFETVKNDPNLQLLNRAPLNVMYVGMNNTYKPFED